MFFPTQPWWATFNITFAVIFVEKLTNSKVKLNPGVSDKTLVLISE